MARAYAGVLGTLAWVVVFTRGALLGAGFEGTAKTAFLAILALAGVGLIVGMIAEATIDDSVRQRLQRQLEQRQLQDKQ